MQKHPQEEQYTEWYHEYHEALFRFCLLKVSRRDVALDLTQESFMRLWDEVREGKHVAHPRAFLYTVARNLIIDYYRKKKSDSLDTLVDEGVELGAEADSEERSSYHEAVTAIHALSPQYREVVYLRYVEGLPPRDIADIVHESVNVVSVRLTRGMKELRDQLGATK